MKKHEEMTLKYYGEQVLRQKSVEIEKIDDTIVELAKKMHEIVKKADGVGLAAPQIGILKRIIVINLGDKKNVYTIINPQIKIASSKMIEWEEGCLSIPGINSNVKRPEQITVTGQTIEGKEMQIEANDLLARVIQHEIDHLDGISCMAKMRDVYTRVPDDVE
jgi:peptide deformylase